MKAFVLVYLMFALNLQAWDFSYRYSLKKDEIAHVVVGTSESKGQKSFDLFFRWTLNVKDRVTVLFNFKGHPYQYILYKKRSLDRVKINLLNDGIDRFADKTYLYLVLSDINQEKKVVDFDIFISDKNKRILVKFEKVK
jgi:hypothetical protein